MHVVGAVVSFCGWITVCNLGPIDFWTQILGFYLEKSARKNGQAPPIRDFWLRFAYAQNARAL